MGGLEKRRVRPREQNQRFLRKHLNIVVVVMKLVAAVLGHGKPNHCFFVLMNLLIGSNPYREFTSASMDAVQG